MIPTVAIVEPRYEIAVLLQEVVTLARCQPVVCDDVAGLASLPARPAAVVVGVTAQHESVRASDGSRQARCGTNDVLDELKGSGCGVIVLHEASEVHALYEVLKDLAAQRWPRAV